MKFVYEKTLLASYNAIEEIINRMDKLFLKTATGSYTCTLPCGEIAERLIDMTQRKLALICVRATVDEALGKLSEGSKKMIRYKYFGEPDEEIDKIRNTRTYFRRQLAALLRFSRALASIGYTEEKFKEECLGFAFMSAVYDEYEEKCGLKKKLPSSCYRIKA